MARALGEQQELYAGRLKLPLFGRADPPSLHGRQILRGPACRTLQLDNPQSIDRLQSLVALIAGSKQRALKPTAGKFKLAPPASSSCSSQQELPLHT